MEKIAHLASSVNVADILTAAGYKIRGRRAGCPHCSGHSKLTVSFTDDGRFYCHRCATGGTICGLARSRGFSLPPARIRRADIPKKQFRDWLRQKMSEMSERENKLVRQWRYALDTLGHRHDSQVWSQAKKTMAMDEAWSALADYYHRERCFQEFWLHASDNVGRFWMYRTWRKRNER